MVARSYNKNENVIDLNAGFALPDPKLEKWQPDEGNVPKAGTKKDSRFDPQNLLSTARRREAERAVASPERSSGPSPKQNIGTVRQRPLDGKGQWGDWGVSAAGASPYIKQQYEAKAKIEEQNRVKNKPSTHGPVPHDIDGMNEVIAARAAADRLRTNETYRNGTASRATPEPQKPVVPEYLPPHLRKKQTKAASSIVVHRSRTTHSDPISSQKPERTLHNPARRTSPPRQTGILPSYLTTSLAVSAQSLVIDQEARRPSSVTLVNEKEDEAYAMRLQRKEYEAEPDAHVQFKGPAQMDIPAHLKSMPPSTKPTSAIEGPELYKRHHKVQEIIWKQDALDNQAYQHSAQNLYQMSEERLDIYLRKIQKLYRLQWNKRIEILQNVMNIQTEMCITNGQSLDDLLRMPSSDLERIDKAALRAYENWMFDSSDSNSMYAEDLCSASSDAGAPTNKSVATDGKVEGRRPRDTDIQDAETGDVDMADNGGDDDEDLIVFSGRG